MAGKKMAALLRSCLPSLVEAHGRRCVYCGVVVQYTRLRKGKRQPSNKATVDHVIPRSKGGTWARENLVLACLKCNNEKADMDRDEFEAWRKTRPRKKIGVAMEKADG